VVAEGVVLPPAEVRREAASSKNSNIGKNTPTSKSLENRTKTMKAKGEEDEVGEEEEEVVEEETEEVAAAI
jgi:hypothetical protein